MPYLINKVKPAVYQAIPLSRDSNVPEVQWGWSDIHEVAEIVNMQPGVLFVKFMNMETRKRRIRGRASETNHVFYYLAPTCGSEPGGMPYRLCALNTVDEEYACHDCVCNGERREVRVGRFMDNPKHKVLVPTGWALAVIEAIQAK